MKFLLLILSLSFFNFDAKAGIFDTIEGLIADDSSRQQGGGNVHVSQADALSNIMIYSKERATKASPREFMMMIQAWRRIASEVKSSPASVIAINNKLMQSQRSDKNNTLIAFQYLLNLTGNSTHDKSKARTSTARILESHIPKQAVNHFAKIIDRTLKAIEQDEQSRLVEVVDVVNKEGKAGEESKEASASVHYPHYPTTDTLVTFEFADDGKGNIDITECIAPHMHAFNTNPKVTYRRPVPAIRAGASFAQHLLIDAAAPEGKENASIDNYYLYKFLLTDDADHKMLYGLPNPVLAPNASLVPLARDESPAILQTRSGWTSISQSMKDRADRVSTWIKENNYLLPAVQHLNGRYGEIYNRVYSEEERLLPQEGAVLANVRIPGFDALRVAKVYVPSTRMQPTQQQITDNKPGNNIFFPVPEAIFVNQSNTYYLSGFAPARIALAYFRDKRAHGYDRHGKEGTKEDLTSRYTVSMLTDRARNQSTTNNLSNILSGDKPSFVLIRSDEDTEVSFTGPHGGQVKKLKSNPNYWDDRNASENETSEIKDLYVLETLYRWDSKLHRLVQVSIGMPEVSILEKKAALEKELRSASGTN